MKKNYKINYQGDLRCLVVHLKSNSEIVTDAPVDNNGKGEAFSPTDLLATGLVTCILTVAAIRFQKSGKELKPISTEVQKIMAENPRRIQEIIIHFNLGDNNFSEDELNLFKHLVKHCPVGESLSADIIITTNL